MRWGLGGTGGGLCDNIVVTGHERLSSAQATHIFTAVPGDGNLHRFAGFPQPLTTTTTVMHRFIPVMATAAALVGLGVFVVFQI